MKWVKFKSDLFVEATNTLHKTGETIEVSEEFAARHGKDGTGMVEETKKPVDLDKKPVDLDK